MYKGLVQIHEQIAAVFDTTGWSVKEFLQYSGLKFDRSGLQKRLRGDAPMRTSEAERLACTLREHGFPITLRWPCRKRAA